MISYLIICYLSVISILLSLINVIVLDFIINFKSYFVKYMMYLNLMVLKTITINKFNFDID